MCNEKTVKYEFYLNDNIRIQGPISNFSLFVKNTLILEHCKDFSFITNKLFVTRSGSTVYVFSTKVVNSRLEELSKFDVTSPEAFTKVVLDNNTYIIDCNCQIIHKCSKKRY